MRSVLWLLFLCHTPLPGMAQAVWATHPPDTDPCQGGNAWAYMQAGRYQALLRNTGTYQIPRFDPITALAPIEQTTFLTTPGAAGQAGIYAHSLWVGGTVGGEVRQAASFMAPPEFFPGPLDAAGRPPDDCTTYDRIYHVSREDVDHYDAGAPPSRDLRDWPGSVAEVVDGDGNPLNYDLAGGDRPRLFGDRTSFWVMNDAGNRHLSTGSDRWNVTSNPIGLEVRAYAFSRGWSPHPMPEALFFRYVLTYRGEAPLEDAYLGLWADFDPSTMFGCDTMLQMGYAYQHADTETGIQVPRPASGLVLLQGPEESGKNLGMTTCLIPYAVTIKYIGEKPLAAYNFMRGLHAEGCPYWFEENAPWDRYGYVCEFRERRGQTGRPTRFMYPGDPATGSYWSMENIDGKGKKAQPYPVTGMIATGPFHMQPGETQEIVYAFTWAQGSNRLDAITLLRENASALHETYRQIIAPPPATNHASRLTQTAAHPNPFRERTVVRYSVPRMAHVAIRLYDALGRERAVLFDGVRDEGAYEAALEGAALEPGVYFYRTWINHTPVVTGRLVRMR